MVSPRTHRNFIPTTLHTVEEGSGINVTRILDSKLSVLTGNSSKNSSKNKIGSALRLQSGNSRERKDSPYARRNRRIKQLKMFGSAEMKSETSPGSKVLSLVTDDDMKNFDSLNDLSKPRVAEDSGRRQFEELIGMYQMSDDDVRKHKESLKKKEKLKIVR